MMKKSILYFNILINTSRSFGSVLYFYRSYQRKEISMLLSKSNSREVSS